MLRCLTRLLRPIPPTVVVEAPVGMLTTTDEYRAAVRRRAAESRAELREVVAGLAHVERVRARIAISKQATSDRESIRSSTWSKEAKEGSKC